MLAALALAAALALPALGGTKDPPIPDQRLASLLRVAAERVAARNETDIRLGTTADVAAQRAGSFEASIFASPSAPTLRDGRPEKAAGHPAQLILCAPADASSTSSGGQNNKAAPSPGGTPSPARAGDSWWQQPLTGRSSGEIIKDDLRLFPRELWKSTTDSLNVPTAIILTAAGGLSVISRGSWDHRVDHSMTENSKSIFDREGDFGSVAGNPWVHVSVALIAYGYGVQTKNDQVYGYSKSLLQALTLTNMTTAGLKLAANDHSPNGEDWAWPSGHTSSTAALAAVTWEYYGWPAGVPLYLLTGWVATSRLDDREHWLSDVIFGAALGSCIGHSVARGRTIEVGGFAVLPYVPPAGGAGIMLARQF